ncbi:aspartic proteinase CDR1-like [Impatiens glandulifera]|uniref:aspartic proteinase CDR1-like n=1 Tax=Impatiens glandulifera TaxID=253017 RepID=UPI001FB0A739|nr:aspartic proteinase CDR1-like [Impatiens glandulifera]
MSSTSALRGFTTDFIHRDSPASPLYDPSITQADRTAKAIHRSMTRLSRFKSTLNHLKNHKVKKTSNTNSTILPGDGEYLIEFSIGTPPFKQVAIADTGSDVTWTQCQPCDRCYQQDQPVFNSENSSTFRTLTCGSNLCESLGYSDACSGTTGTCEYQLQYGDGSTSTGVLALDTYTLGGTSIPKLVYGCSHDSQGTFEADAAGIVGLGGGPLSLVGQLGSSIAGKFSYCLLSDHSSGESSKINFGSNAIVSGPNVVSTPMVSKSPDTFYYLTLESISVDGNTSIPFKSRKPFAAVEGNIIIDSGTTLTYIPPDMYQNLEDTMKSAIKADPVPDPEGYFSLCYNIDESFTAPTITAHFAGGADLVLPWTSTFYVYENVGCLAFSSSDSDEFNIYGNMSQMDFLIGYDLENRTVSFKPTDCSQE